MVTTQHEPRKGSDNNLIVLTIRGEPASKANSRRLVMMGGKPRFIKSKKALAYKKSFDLHCPVSSELLDQDLAIAMKIYYRTRRPDLDESLILDLLQDKVYKNDRSIKMKYVLHGLDKENPRTVLVVGPVENKDEIISTLSKLV
jgi:Holliday junction resolvase RusA-like endonuclease|tara:strand:+ start:79 stop:510 length:432 start_codon:yes stop_codon:yes gene_type:complete